MICEFGEIVVVPFPFVDRPIAKRRPALVLSNTAFNGDHGQSILAMITSAVRSEWPSDIPIEDIASTGLAHASLVRWKLFTLPNDVILKRLGVLGATDRKRVSNFSAQTIAAA